MINHFIQAKVAPKSLMNIIDRLYHPDREVSGREWTWRSSGVEYRPYPGRVPKRGHVLESLGNSGVWNPAFAASTVRVLHLRIDLKRLLGLFSFFAGCGRRPVAVGLPTDRFLADHCEHGVTDVFG